MCRGLILLAFLVFVGCSHSVEVTNSVKVEDKVEITASWVKEKGDTFDAEVWVNNNDKKALVLFATDVECKKGSQTGDVNIRTDILRIPSEGRARFIITCVVPNDAGPEYIVKFRRVRFQSDETKIAYRDVEYNIKTTQ